MNAWQQDKDLVVPLAFILGSLVWMGLVIWVTLSCFEVLVDFTYSGKVVAWLSSAGVPAFFLAFRVSIACLAFFFLLAVFPPFLLWVYFRNRNAKDASATPQK